ncbi:MAG: type II toxin-antitoxin system VapC family toxin [Blastocatellia bacterium]|nr:type II toxin-antitoxin system VapC family toxin [Blastocatellia bacterium]
MSYLIDTNVLLRLIQKSHPMHKDAADSIRNLMAAGEELCIVPQNLIEFWAVATRPANYNGLGLTIDEAEQELSKLKSIFILRLDIPIIFSEWEKLVKHHKVAGRQAHDARLVAAMLAHGISHLLTFNTDDFKRFAAITAVNPHDVMAP